MAEIKTYHPVTPKLKSKPKSSSSKTPESKYWSSFKTHPIPDLISSITSLTFSPASPHDFAATYSASLSLFSSQTLSSNSKISSFSDIAYSASFRSDGLLLAASSQSGLIKVFDVKTRSALRTLRGHTRPVRLAKYPVADKLHLFSGGDDALVKYWDVVAEIQLVEFRGHKDYVRCGDGSPVSSDMFITGSYDHTVRLWDVRVSGSDSVLEINHGKPVEDVVFLPSGGLIATAGGNVVKIWDVIGGGKMVYSMESHNKTVTSICVGKVGRDSGDESEQYRVLSVSLDGYMKVFDYSKLKITHSMRFPAPLLSIAISPDCITRAIGSSNGIIYAGKKKRKEIVESGLREPVGLGSIEEPQKRILKPSYFRYFHRSQGEKPSEGDYLVMKPKTVKFAQHDKLLKKFRHKEALVSVLGGKNPENVIAVMEELVARKKLLKCVSNLDKEELGLLLVFLQRHLTMPRYSSLLMGLSKKAVKFWVEQYEKDPKLAMAELLMVLFEECGAKFHFRGDFVDEADLISTPPSVYRQVASLAGFQLVTSYITVAKMLDAQRETTHRQLNAEKKKRTDGPCVESLNKWLSVPSSLNKWKQPTSFSMRKAFSKYEDDQIPSSSSWISMISVSCFLCSTTS